MTAYEQLLQVQATDRDIARLNHQKQTLPEREAFLSLDEKLTQAVALQQRLEAHLKELDLDQQRTEAEVAEAETSLQEANTRLYSGEISGIRAIEALQEQIAALKRRKNTGEEIVIEILERREKAESNRQVIDEKHTKISEAHSEKSSILQEREAEIDAELSELSALRTEQIQAIPEALLTDYEERRDRLGGIGVAAMVGRHCVGCDLNLMHPIAEVERMQQANADAPIDCSECGRMIVLEQQT